MMSVPNPTHATTFYFFIFFSISSFKLGYSVGNNIISFLCPNIEKQSLLSFKQSFKDPENQLSSWDGEVINCCRWKGVICNNFTGHVHQLSLPNMRLDGKINPSLLNLKYLSYLDLRGNYLLGGTMPSFKGSFAKLEYLNLSNTGFRGKDSLNMNFVNLSKANNWAQVINYLPSLKELHINYCSLEFMAPLDDVNITTSLNHLDLSVNHFTSITMPPWIFQLRNLLFLDLSSNSFDGPIPTISNATKLQHIDLSCNNLISSIPDWLYLCKDLDFLSLGVNLLSGTISNSIANLTSLNTLLAPDNQLSGIIPKEITSLCKIQSLVLFSNNFQGEITDSFGNMSECFLEAMEDLSLWGKLSSLERLRLLGNKFTGTLPESLGQLSNLRELSIEDNRLEGAVTEAHFVNLTNLQTLSASRNQLTLKLTPNWIPPFQLTLLALASWNLGLGSHILLWLQKQKNILSLDLSNTGISGNIPGWVWKISSLTLPHNNLHGNIQIADTMRELDLSNNSFSGSISHFLYTMRELDLSNNSFSGSISHFLCDTTFETYQLGSLHLGGNQLSGDFPDCWKKWPILQYLNLGKNNISGSIPSSIGLLEHLQSLNLYGNRLSGEIPFSIHNCTELGLINLGDNDLDGGIPTWVGTHLVHLRFLILRSNKLSGKIFPEICLLNSLQILDLSDNKLSGIIPSCLSNLSGMATKRSLNRWIPRNDGVNQSLTTESASVAIKGSYSVGNNIISFLCPNIEKQSLLSFKQSFKDPENQLSSWDGEVINCCRWKGVICNNFTGHVHQLSLPNMRLDGKINPSLLNLKYLSYLDLSGNYLLGGTMPSFKGSFAKLEYLNLSNTGFRGKVPHTIGNLSNLHTLDLGFAGGFLGDLIDSLNMNFVNLSKANNWAQVINYLPSLKELHINYCSLEFMAPLDDVNITTSLNHLDLSVNHFTSITMPPWIFQLRNLLFLDLSSNSFDGPIPTISNATKLQHIDLSCNNLISSIPDWLYLCKDLDFLSLGVNLLSGTISNSIANLTSLNTLLAPDNQLSGIIPKEITSLCKIQSLVLFSNNFQGEITDSFGNMSECFLEAMEDLSLWGKLSSLERLRLLGNKFTGTLPESLGQLSNLRELSIEDNRLEGAVTEAHFVNLTNLQTLSASRNQLTLKLTPNWIPPFQLTLLALASWNLGLGSHILLWLQKQKNILSLDLSNTGISGNIPGWVWKISSLTLPHNNLHGNIQIADTMRELDLSNNSFSGSISHFLCATTFETYRLESLHLGGNQLSGDFPDCWEKWPILQYLNLGKNNISGSIPSSIGLLEYLQSLNLYGNRLSGEIPFSVRNCTELGLIKLGDNDLDGGIPTWVGTHLVHLRFLILRSNKLSGKIFPEICLLNSLQILDLSDNKLSGIIPSCLSNLSGMATKRSLNRWIPRNDGVNQSLTTESASVAIKGSELEYGTTIYLVTNINLSKNNLSGNIPKELTRLVELRSLNLSQNRLSGSIPEKIGDMKQLESLDFSMNALSGQIPKSLAILSFLKYLNISYNNLTGEIPKSTQLLGLDASGFIGNSLCALHCQQSATMAVTKGMKRRRSMKKNLR
ncbi:hypothetical protein ACS0TY_035863 [Phlomoides rotata]